VGGSREEAQVRGVESQVCLLFFCSRLSLLTLFIHFLIIFLIVRQDALKNPEPVQREAPTGNVGAKWNPQGSGSSDSV
jgi:hypothetical protein